MSKIVTAALSLALASIPADLRPAAYKLTLTPVDGSSPLTGTAPVDSTSVVVSAVPAGTYVGVVALVDDAGRELAPAVTCTPSPFIFTDPVTTVSVNVPTAATLTAA